MREDNTVVVASYLVIGLTEEDVYYIRKGLEAYAHSSWKTKVMLINTLLS